MPWIEKIVDKHPNWKESLINLVGRSLMVKFVLYVISVYLLLAMNAPKWMIKSIDKIRRGLLERRQNAPSIPLARYTYLLSKCQVQGHDPKEEAKAKQWTPKATMSAPFAQVTKTTGWTHVRGAPFA
jgi:hypothetical protein